MLTGAGQLWVSAAIGFILISGFVFGTIYRRRIVTQGWQWSIQQIGRRALQLYFLSAFSRLALATGDYILRLFWERPSSVPENYWHVIDGALFHTRYGFGHTDMLVLYALLLPMGLVALYFLASGKWQIVITGSFFLWYANYTDANIMHLFRIGFPVFAWQLPFILSLVAGYYHQEIGTWWAKRPFPRFALLLFIILPFLLLVISYLITFHGLWAGIDWKQINFTFFNKSLVAPGRLLLAFWLFASTYKLLTLFWHILQRLLGWLFLPLGQNALIAYLIQGFGTYFVSRAPGYPFPRHDPIIMGFIHLAFVIFVWGTTKFIANHLGNLQWLQKTLPIISQKMKNPYPTTTYK